MPDKMPAEWAPHRAVWIGFPGDPAEWPEPHVLAGAQAEVAAFASAVHADGAGEHVVLVARSAEDAAIARTLVANGVNVIERFFGDIWLRDTGAIVTGGRAGPTAHRYGFNGWGGKFDMAGDQEIGEVLAEEMGLSVRRHHLILEGGAIDVDGEGLVVTTEQCLLNPNRNPLVPREAIEERIGLTFGIESWLWLGDGLLNDHTDGHVDNLARFVAPGVLALPVAEGDDDPNADIYADAHARAKAFGVEIAPIPSPGRIEVDGGVVPASYMNFYIGNAAVVVPVYGAANDAKAVEVIGALFPTRRAVGIRANNLLAGGGSFHCSSQQVPT